MAETQAKDGFFFTEKHEWVTMEGDFAKIGISDYAQNALGDIVFIDLPKIGKKVQAKDSLGTIESVKAAEDLYSPISGEVTEINASLSQDPGQVNSGPFEAWMVKMKGFSSADLSGLMNAAQYRDFVSKLD